MTLMNVREADVNLSNNQRDFIVKVKPSGNACCCQVRTVVSRAALPQALHEEVRVDGRAPGDYRKVAFEYTLDDSSCTVLLGQTRVLSVVTATLEAPYPLKSLQCNVQLR